MRVVSTHVLGKREPQPTLPVVCSEGKSSQMGEPSSAIVSMTHLGRLFDPVLGARMELSQCDGLEASLHPFFISYELSRCFLVP